jgi:hypothetical protein
MDCTSGSNSWFAPGSSAYDNVDGGIVSNFTFMNNNWPELFETAREAEQNVASTSLSSQ